MNVVGQGHAVPLECLKKKKSVAVENDARRLRLSFSDGRIDLLRRSRFGEESMRYRYLVSTGLEASPRRPQCRPLVEEGQESGISSGGGRAQVRDKTVGDPSVASGSIQRWGEGS